MFQPSTQDRPLTSHQPWPMRPSPAPEVVLQITGLTRVYG